MNINDIITKAEEILRTNHISADVEQFETLPVVTVHISWGDWKHEHLRAKYLLETNLPLKKYNEETTESDGSDCYSALHTFIITA